jgi:translocation and assembly module TamA
VRHAAHFVVVAYGFTALLIAAAALGADPQRYSVHFAHTPDGALNTMLEGTSELAALRKSAPVGPFALMGRARTDVGQLQTVLQSFGYYQGNVAITIDSLPLDDPGLGDELTNKTAKDEAVVAIAFNLGPQYHLGKIELTGDVPPQAAAALKLSSGAPAVAAEVLAAAERVRRALAEDGYAFAKVDPPHAKENSSARVLNVSIHIAPGERSRLGEIRLTGLHMTNPAYVRKRLQIHTGDEYRASAMEAARQDLLATGVFTQVSVALDSAPDASGRVPVTFKFSERKPHSAGFTAAYSSDLGASAGVNWLKRDLTGNADSLALSANVLNLGGGTATNGIGYDLNGKYLIPDWQTRDQSLLVNAGALRQYLDAYDQTAVLTGVTVIRKLSRIWSVSAGFTAEREQIIQEAPPDAALSAAVGCTRNIAPPLVGTTEPRCTYDYTLLGVPLTGTYNTTGLDTPLEDATKGVRASLTLTPTFSLGHPSAQFLVAQLTASAYFDLNNLGLASAPGRSVLAVRALDGLAAGASQYSLPPDQRFYAGGSGTIRGYRYQSVGPTFADGNPIGGTAINAGTIEFRQRVGAALGFVTFVDAGNVSRTLNPLDGSPKVGVGAGVRYYTALGPLRIDVAAPLQRRSGPGVVNPDEAFQVYVGLGQAF